MHFIISFFKNLEKFFFISQYYKSDYESDYLNVILLSWNSWFIWTYKYCNLLPNCVYYFALPGRKLRFKLWPSSSTKINSHLCAFCKFVLHLTSFYFVCLYFPFIPLPSLTAKDFTSFFRIVLKTHLLCFEPVIVHLNFSSKNNLRTKMVLNIYIFRNKNDRFFPRVPWRE